MPAWGPEDDAVRATAVELEGSRGAPFPDFTTMAFAQGNAAAQALFAEIQSLKQKVASLERWKGQSISDMKAMNTEIKRLTALTGGSGGGNTKNDKDSRRLEDGVMKLDPPKKAALPDGCDLLPPPPQPPVRAQSLPWSTPTSDSLLSSPPGLALPLPLPEVKTELTMIGGVLAPRVEWRIENVRIKLRSCAGKPLVSPPFEAKGLSNLRLMVYPGSDQGRGLRSRDQKSKYDSMINSGPLNGALKFKVTSAGAQSVLTFDLFVGDLRSGPMRHNFAEHVVQGCDDFKANWLEQIDPNGSLVVGVELIDVQAP